MDYVFYDIETTGINKYFDQILQFAAIKTDDDFNEIERFEIRCRLLPHIIPSPTALRITGITIEQLLNDNLPSHYKMMSTIKSKCDEWSPSVFIGWNSIPFDEEFLRQGLYQNLHPPYLTNTNRNCRTDALSIVMSATQYGSSNIKIPTSVNGKPTFKLDQIAPENGFLNHNAHDAMGDVEATIHMCKLVDSNVPDCWSNAIRFSQKASVISFITEEIVYLYTAIYYGKAYSYFVTTLGPRTNIKTQYYVFDLSVDVEELNEMGDVELSRRLSGRPKPVRKIKTNASPVIHLEDECPELIRDTFPELTIMKERADYLKNNPSLVQRLISLSEINEKIYPPSEHIEQQIYESFTTDEDRIRTDKFHEANWEDALDIIDECSDERLKLLANRLIYNEYPAALDPDLKRDMDKEIARKQLGIGYDSTEWNTLPEAIIEIDGLIKIADDSETVQLQSIRSFFIEKQQAALSILE